MLAGLAGGAALFVARDAFAMPAPALDAGGELGVDLYPLDDDVQQGEAMDGDKNLAAFLAMIREAEGTAGPMGYHMLVGGGVFDSFADHPRKLVSITSRGRVIRSTAAGAYQILARTWDGVRAGLPDFSPESQDEAAKRLIARRGAMPDVRAGRLSEALRKCAPEWASLPGAPYGQPTITVADAAAIYGDNGGEFA